MQNYKKLLNYHHQKARKFKKKNPTRRLHPLVGLFKFSRKVKKYLTQNYTDSSVIVSITMKAEEKHLFYLPVLFLVVSISCSVVLKKLNLIFWITYYYIGIFHLPLKTEAIRRAL